MRKQCNHAETGCYYEQGGQLEVAIRDDYERGGQLEVANRDNCGRGGQPAALKDAETHCCYEQRKAARQNYSAQIVRSSQWSSNKSNGTPKAVFNSSYKANRANRAHYVIKEKRKRRVDSATDYRYECDR